jgi:phage tail-like protein
MGINTIDDRGSIISDPLRNFRFKAEFKISNPFDNRIGNGTTGFTGGFTAIDGLTINNQAIEYREGGYNTTSHYVPGKTVFTPVTFQRGVLWGNDEAITWMRGIFAVGSGEGFSLGSATGGATDVAGQFRCTVKISVMDHPNAENKENKQRIAFILKNAWISGLSFNGLDAGGNSLLTESMTLQHEGLSVAFTNDDGTAKDAENKPSGL